MYAFTYVHYTVYDIEEFGHWPPFCCTFLPGITRHLIQTLTSHFNKMHYVTVASSSFVCAWKTVDINCYVH